MVGVPGLIYKCSLPFSGLKGPNALEAVINESLRALFSNPRLASQTGGFGVRKPSKCNFFKILNQISI